MSSSVRSPPFGFFGRRARVIGVTLDGVVPGVGSSGRTLTSDAHRAWMRQTEGQPALERVLILAWLALRPHRASPGERLAHVVNAQGARVHEPAQSGCCAPQTVVPG